MLLVRTMLEHISSIYLPIYLPISIYNRDVNDAELLMTSRDYWFLMPSRDFHSRKKNEPEPRL